MQTKTQTTKILRHLRAGNTISPLSAYTRFKCMRLAARIEELRDAGWQIASRMLNRNGRRYASYRLA